MNNAVFRKTMGNVRNHRNIKLAIAEKRRNYLAWDPNFHTNKFFTETLLAIKTKKTGIRMNKPVCLGPPIQELSKILKYEFWYDYVRPKYSEKASLCYMDTEKRLIVYLKADDIYKDIIEDVETRFDTSSYELDRPLPKEKFKK